MILGRIFSCRPTRLRRLLSSVTPKNHSIETILGYYSHVLQLELFINYVVLTQTPTGSSPEDPFEAINHKLKSGK